MIEFLLELVLGPFAPIIAAIIGGVALFFAGKHQANRTRDAKEDAERLKSIKKANEVRNEVETLDDTGLADRASRWVHGSKH